MRLSENQKDNLRETLALAVENLFHHKAKADGDMEHLQLLAHDLNTGILAAEVLPLSPSEVTASGAIFSRIKESLASLRAVENHLPEIQRWLADYPKHNLPALPAWWETAYSLLGRESWKAD